MYLVKTPRLLQTLLPGYTWKMPASSSQKTIFLTFDDGPVPEITPWVLEQLAEYKAKATFFCIGKHANQHPEIVKNIVKQGHTIGNHTYSHSTNFGFFSVEEIVAATEGRLIVEGEIPEMQL